MSIQLTPTAQNAYAELTPAGAFFVASSPAADETRHILLRILREGHTAIFSEGLAQQWTGADTREDALRKIFRLQRLGLLHGAQEHRGTPAERLEDALPPLMEQLSDSKKTLLADENGFYLFSAGFHHEAAEELAGLSADLISLQARHERLLRNNLRLHTESWALVDPAGQSELGFWPLFIGQHRFMLVIGGTPLLQNQSIVTLIQSLDERYR